MGGVRTLQARFHFFPGDEQPIVVGHILWPADAPDGRPSIRPTFTTARRNWPVQVVTDLQNLVAATHPNSFQGLLALKHPSWSFVDVSPEVSTKEGYDQLVRTINQVTGGSDPAAPVVVVY